MTEFAYIRGIGQATLNGALDTGGALVTYYEYVVYDCTINDLSLGNNNGITLYDCTINDATCGTGTVITSVKTVFNGGDFSNCVSMIAQNGQIGGGTYSSTLSISPSGSIYTLGTAPILNGGIFIGSYITAGTLNAGTYAFTNLSFNRNTDDIVFDGAGFSNCSFINCKITTNTLTISGDAEFNFTNCSFITTGAFTIDGAATVVEFKDCTGIDNLVITNNATVTNQGAFYDNRESRLTTDNVQAAIDELSSDVSTKETRLTITGTISNGTTFNTTASGVNYTHSNDFGYLETSQGLFRNDLGIQVLLNGLVRDKETEVLWLTSQTFQLINSTVDSGDLITIFS